jgi:hypothetical protein
LFPGRSLTGISDLHARFLAVDFIPAVTRKGHSANDYCPVKGLKMMLSRVVLVLIIVAALSYGYLVFSTVIRPEASPFTQTSEPVEESGKKRIVVAFRNDDLTVYSDPAHEDSILSLFWKYRVKQAFGFIPDPNLYVTGNADTFQVNTVMIDSLKAWNAGGKIDLAIHGYSHLRSPGSSGEFDGLPYELQIARIKRAKAMTDSILHVDVRMFAPPFNQADAHTIRACRDVGVTLFSGYVGETPLEGITQVNCNAVLFNRGAPLPRLKEMGSADYSGLPDFEDVFQRAREGPGSAVVVAFYHSAADFSDPRTYTYLDSLLGGLSTDTLVEYASFGDIHERHPNLIAAYAASGWNISEAEASVNRSRPYIDAARTVRGFFSAGLLIDGLHDRALRSYWAGEYGRARVLAEKIVQESDGYLVIGRLIAILGGCALFLLGAGVLRLRKKEITSGFLLRSGGAVLGCFLVAITLLHLASHLSPLRIAEFSLLGGLCVGPVVLGLLLMAGVVGHRSTHGISKGSG